MSGPAPFASGAAPLFLLPAAGDSPGGPQPLASLLGEAYVTIGTLLLVVSRSLSLKREGQRHLKSCRIGQWVDGHHGPDGAPCSPSCVDAGGAYLLGLAVLGGDIRGLP